MESETSTPQILLLPLVTSRHAGRAKMRWLKFLFLLSAFSTHHISDITSLQWRGKEQSRGSHQNRAPGPDSCVREYRLEGGGKDGDHLSQPPISPSIVWLELPFWQDPMCGMDGATQQSLTLPRELDTYSRLCFLQGTEATGALA